MQRSACHVRTLCDYVAMALCRYYVCYFSFRNTTVRLLPVSTPIRVPSSTSHMCFFLRCFVHTESQSRCAGDWFLVQSLAPGQDFGRKLEVCCFPHDYIVCIYVCRNNIYPWDSCVATRLAFPAGAFSTGKFVLLLC